VSISAEIRYSSRRILMPFHPVRCCGAKQYRRWRDGFRFWTLKRRNLTPVEPFAQGGECFAKLAGKRQRISQIFVCQWRISIGQPFGLIFGLIIGSLMCTNRFLTSKASINPRSDRWCAPHQPRTWGPIVSAFISIQICNTFKCRQPDPRCHALGQAVIEKMISANPPPRNSGLIRLRMS
jgi:hypothetical protein